MYVRRCAPLRRIAQDEVETTSAAGGRKLLAGKEVPDSVIVLSHCVPYLLAL
jgi:hypothetical protein